MGRGIPWERISKCFFVVNRVYPYLQGCGWHPLPVLLHSWLPLDGTGSLSPFFQLSKTSLGCLPPQLQLAVAADRTHSPLPPLPLLLVGCPGIRQVADIKGAAVLDCIMINVLTQRFPGSV